MIDKLYTTKELADLLQVTEKSVRDFLVAGTMEGYKVGNRWRVSNTQLEEFLIKGTQNNEIIKGDK